VWGFLALATLHLVLVFAFAPILPEDDAFITLRYARNMDQTQGFVFNPGERVLGTTSPAHALLLAAAGRATGTGALPRDAVLLNGFWILLTAAGGYTLFRGLALPFPLPQLGAAWVLLSPQVLTMGLGGMEVCLFAGVTVWVLALAVHGRWVPAAAMVALSVLVRPEGLLLLLVFALWWWGSHRPSPVAVPGIVSLILGSWALFATLYFGSPIPQSVLAKVHAAGAADGGATARQLLALMAGWIFGGPATLPGTGLVGTGGLAALVVTIGLMLGVLVAVSRGWLAPPAFWIPVWFAAAAGGYALANPFWFPWYAMMVLIPWWLTVIAGTAGLEAWIGRRNPRWSWTPVLLLALVLGTRLLGAAGAMTLPNWPGAAYGVTTPYRARVLAYAAAAQWLNGHAPDGSSVLSNEIGALGYVYHRGPVLDAWGLVTPPALAFAHETAKGRGSGTSIAPALLESLQPTYVVALPSALEELQGSPWFTDSYRLVGTFPVPGKESASYRLHLYELIPEKRPSRHHTSAQAPHSGKRALMLLERVLLGKLA